MAIELTTATAATLSGIQAFTSALAIEIVLPNAKLYSSSGVTYVGDNGQSTGDTLDFTHPTFRRVAQLQFANYPSLTKIIGGQNLVSLQDVGTQVSVFLNSCGFSAATLNAFFTALPATVGTATIRVAGNPGAATCTTSIATNKGYTVVTS